MATIVVLHIKPAMSDPNGLLSQKLSHSPNQGRTLNDIIMRASHWIAHFCLSKLNLALLTYSKRANTNCNGIRRDKVVLITTCIESVKIQDYQNKERFSVYSILQLQRKPKVGHTKLSTGPHAALWLRLDIAVISIWTVWSQPSHLHHMLLRGPVSFCKKAQNEIAVFSLLLARCLNL